MLRIIHTADVHLGARHDDLGEQRSPSANASSPRSSPRSIWRIAEKVDLFLIAGDLFDSNVQPRAPSSAWPRS
jgi:DNA repair exonuclease SbcCD nuclease subunit